MISVLSIIEDTMVDGPGFRTSIYCAGCLHQCQGCHNPQSWDFQGGHPMTTEQIMQVIEADPYANVTFTGGDPMYQPEGFAELARAIRQRTNKTIWCYTGFTYEHLVNNPRQLALLRQIDVLVDGPFVKAQRDETLRFRGSSNQRIIDVRASLAQGTVVAWHDDDEMTCPPQTDTKSRSDRLSARTLLTCLMLLLWSHGAVSQNTTDVMVGDTLQEVTVTSRSAEKRMDEVQIGVEKIEVSTLAKMPSLFGEKDIVKGIQLLPGVKSESEATGGYQVRGGKASQNLILLDGATVYNAGHLMGLFSTFNDDALMDASLYKGLVPAQLGGGTASVFDISTRSGSLSDYHYGGTVGLLSAKVMAEGPIREGRSSFLVAGRRSYLDLLLKADKDYRDNTMHFYDANVRLNFRLSARDVLSLSFFRGRDNMGLEDMMRMEWGNTTATANYLHTFSDRLYANTQLIYSDFLSDVGIDILNTYYTMKGYTRHATLRHQQVLNAGHHRLCYGLESTYLQLQSAEWDINLLHQREKRNAWTSGLWLNDEWRLGRSLHLSAGLRLHLFSVLGDAPYYRIDTEGNIAETLHPKGIVKTYADVEPRVSLKFDVAPRHSLKVGYSRTSQDIHAISAASMSMPFDRYTMSSNIVKPEKADQMAFGWVGMTADGAYDFSLEGYYKSIDNVYDYRDGKSFYSEIEIERLLLGGKGRAYGVEACAHKNKGPLTGWVSYTLAWSENKIEGINGGQWYTASNDRRHDIAVVAIYQLSHKWELSGVWRYNTGQALTAPSAKYDIDGTTYYYYSERNGYRAPAYHRLDLSANYTMKGSRFTRVWSFGIYNAYCRYNPFTITFKNDDKSPSGTVCEQTSLFGIVPSVSFTLKY